jgi:hypothetical protein
VVVIPSFVPHTAHCDPHTRYRALCRNGWTEISTP